MKRGLSVALIVVAITLLSGCMSLFTALSVEEPLTGESSMLVVEIGENYNYLVNNNYTGWAPIVKDSNGNVVPFQMINAISNAATIYVAANITPGVYTMTGLRHVYTDYGLLKDGDYPEYEPYVERPYHVQQFFPLEKPIKVTVPVKSMTTLGYYDISFEWNGGGFAGKDDRWKAVESTVKIKSNPESKKLLQVIKYSMNSDNWKLWNERNPEPPYKK